MKRNRTPGRRPKLDDEMIGRICGQIKKANTIRTAVLSCGIGLATYYEWKARGEDDRKQWEAWKANPDPEVMKKPPESTKFTRFLDELEHAEAVAQQRLVRDILYQGPWKAKLEILKRRFPKEFGDKTALTNADGTPLAPIGGPPINVHFKLNAPLDDDPFIIDPSMLPPMDGEDPPTGAAPAVPAGPGPSNPPLSGAN